MWKGGGRTWAFVATDVATWAYVLRGSRLAVAWRSSRPGTSPVVAGGLLYVYDPNGGLERLRPGERAGSSRRCPAGRGHWNSPIATDGRVALPEGNANDHATSGVLDIWRVSG